MTSATETCLPDWAAAGQAAGAGELFGRLVGSGLVRGWRRNVAPDGTAAAAIVVPARNEAARIATCLEHCRLAIAASRVPVRLVVVVNNSTDGSGAVAKAWARRHDMPLDLVDITLPDAVAHAGAARRLAWDLGRSVVDGRGLLMTTDADSRPERDWVTANLRAAAAGAALVCGRIALDAAEAAALPGGFLDSWAIETDYAATALELASLIDPDPHNPWPHHGQVSGASLAVTAAAYDRVGGAPVVPVGEDRELAARLHAFDLQVRYSDAARVVTSCRLDGRAVGGMATTIRARLLAADADCDERLEPALATYFRARLRARLRRAWGRPEALGGLMERLGLGGPTRDAIVQHAHFGAAWAVLEAMLPALRRARLKRAQLAAELPVLRRLVQRARGGVAGTAGDALVSPGPRRRGDGGLRCG